MINVVLFGLEWIQYIYIFTFSKWNDFVLLQTRTYINLLNTVYCANQRKLKYVILTKEIYNRKVSENYARCLIVYFYGIVSHFVIALTEYIFF